MTLIQKTNDGELYYYDIYELTDIQAPNIWVYKNKSSIVVAYVGYGEPRSGIISSHESIDQMNDKINEWHKVLEEEISIDDLDYVKHEVYYMAKIDDNNELIIFKAIGGDWLGIPLGKILPRDNFQLPLGWNPEYISILKRLKAQRDDI